MQSFKVCLQINCLHGYIKAPAFSISDSLFFELGLNGSGLGLTITICNKIIDGQVTVIDSVTTRS